MAKKIIETEKFKDLEKRANAYKWSSLKKGEWSDWGLLFRFLVVICKLLSNSLFTKRKAKKRKPSEWNLFVSKMAKQGKSFKEIGRLWRAKIK